MRFGLSENTVLKINNVFEQYAEVEKAVVYGSRAKGDFKTYSDIDITLKGAQIDLKILSGITLKLDDLLLPYKFDLSIYNHLSNTELIEHIDRVGKVLWESNRRSPHICTPIN